MIWFDLTSKIMIRPGLDESTEESTEDDDVDNIDNENAKKWKKTKKRVEILDSSLIYQIDNDDNDIPKQRIVAVNHLKITCKITTTLNIQWVIMNLINPWLVIKMQRREKIKTKFRRKFRCFKFYKYAMIGVD